ncbi:MAG: hypothetical protein PF481_06560 [Bacteroidales bacterium]|jgi:hypothetical protein|nr:hypothetical protein [Bacteroidales bacterium]
MKFFSTLVVSLYFSLSLCAQSYPEWETMEDNYTISIADDAVFKTGILAVNTDLATINSSSSDSISALFSSSQNNAITVTSSKKDTICTDYFSIDFYDFLYNQGQYNGWELSGTIIDLSSGNQKVIIEAETNIPVVFEVQLIDVNGHVTNNDFQICDTLYPSSEIDTLVFENFLLEDWYSQEWWVVNNDRGEQSYFPEEAIIPVYDSKIVSVRVFVKPLSQRTPSAHDISVTLHTVRILANNPIVELPPQPHVSPYYETSDTLYISDFFFDENTSIDDITWSFYTSDPSVIVEYKADEEIIVISNLSKPTTIDITATNDFDFSCTEQYYVFYVNSISTIAQSVFVYNAYEQKLVSDIISSGILSCYSITGSRIGAFNIENGSVDISQVPNGVFIYTVEYQGIMYSGKICKNHL